MRTPTVDREQELARFSEFLQLAEKGESRALLIEEASGHGKSRLVQRFRAACQERVVAWSFLDLVGGSLTPIDILRRMISDLESVGFGRCQAVLNRPSVASVPVGITDNKAVGKMTNIVEVTVNATPTPEEQRQFWGQAAEGFRQDLASYRKTAGSRAIVLLIDTFEKAAPETKVWISDHLLPAVACNRVAGLLIVLAGKTCPRPSSEWEAE